VLRLLGSTTFTKNQWAMVYVEPGSAFTGRDVKFLKNQIGVAISGKETVANAIFEETEVTTLQAAGPEATVEVKEKQAVVAANLSLTRCVFSENTIHLVSAKGTTIIDDGGESTGATGGYGVHVVEGVATFRQVQI
jgi:hypothetical protein